MDGYTPQRIAADRTRAEREGKARKLKTFGRPEILEAMDTRWWLISEISRRLGVDQRKVIPHLAHMAREEILEVDHAYIEGGHKSVMYRRATQ